jgi:hypothetical protein
MGEAEIFKICVFQSFEDDGKSLVGEHGVTRSCERS